MIRAKSTQPPSAEVLKENWDKFLGIIDTYISSPRKEKLLKFYQQNEERFIFMPASHRSDYHNCYEGGYIAHVLNVVDAALKLDKVWRDMSVKDTYTTEELVFAALNHDLGKFGDFENTAVIPQTDEWRKNKLGELYQFNTQLAYMTVPDRSLWILSHLGISMTQNEYTSIKVHDGLYDQSNEAYLKSWAPETKPRTSLVYIIHQADLLAARIEFEVEHLDKFNQPKKQEIKETPKAYKKSMTEEKVMRNLGNKSDGLVDMLKNL